MIKLYLVAEFSDAETIEEAREQFDAFREAVQPSAEYGIALYQAE